MTNDELFLFQENKESDKLVIVFSGVNAKSFMGYKLVKEFECNKIFIRELNKSWYHKPLEGISNSIDELILHIKKFTDKL